VKMQDGAALERARTLMMQALDGEISAGERRELDDLITGSPELVAEWRRLRRVKEVTTDMTLQNPPAEIWDGYWTSVYRRTERGLAWVLISIGVTIPAAYWVWHVIRSFLADTNMPLFLKLPIAALAIGVLLLVISVVREKLFTARRDPYVKEVIR